MTTPIDQPSTKDTGAPETTDKANKDVPDQKKSDKIGKKVADTLAALNASQPKTSASQAKNSDSQSKTSASRYHMPNMSFVPKTILKKLCLKVTGQKTSLEQSKKLPCGLGYRGVFTL